MPKQCQHIGCYNNVFSHNFCKWHQNDRVDSKFITQKNKPKTFTKETSLEGQSEIDFFEDIWIASDKRSFVSGEDLVKWAGMVIDGEFVKNKMFHWLFHHVLQTKNYKKYMFYKKNVILLTPQEHILVHSETKEKLLELNPRWQLVFDMEEDLKLQYPIIK
jgi:hypothetical protein